MVARAGGLSTSNGVPWKLPAWAVLKAGGVWYCLAQKADADTARLKRLLPMDMKAISKCAGKPCNAEHVVPMEKWLAGSQTTADKERLCQLGNAVVPRAGEVVLTCLAHM